MSDFLMGKEVSGTPTETRGAVSDLARILQQTLRTGGLQGITSQFQGLGTDALMALLTIPEVAQQLISPADKTRGLFASMEPFEARETERQAAGIRNIFGTAGGRFSRNVGEAEGLLRGELANQFTRARQEALIGADQTRAQFLAQLLGVGTEMGRTSLGGLSSIMQFLQPGAPQFQQGALPGLLSAGASIYTGMKLFGGPGGGATSTGSRFQYTPSTSLIGSSYTPSIPPIRRAY